MSVHLEPSFTASTQAVCAPGGTSLCARIWCLPQRPQGRRRLDGRPPAQGNAVIVLDVNSNNRVNGNLYPHVASAGDCCAACRADIQVRRAAQALPPAL